MIFVLFIGPAKHFCKIGNLIAIAAKLSLVFFNWTFLNGLADSLGLEKLEL